jgi:hypothetical protein
MQLNFYLTCAISALVPLIVGFIWYNPSVFGKTWLNINGFDEEKMKQGFNMPLVFGLTFLFGFFISFILSGMVIHQMGFFSMLQNHFKEPEIQKLFKDVMSTSTLATDFRTFKHGAFHGIIATIGLVLPIIGINALFERRGFKYIALHVGYWLVCLILMGGFICQFADLNSLG